MVSRFRAVADEFCAEIQVVQALVSSFDRTEEQSRLKAAVSNAAVLLLAATFEGFVRDMAGLAARAAVAGAGQVTHVPNRILRTAWQRTFNSIARFEIPQNTRTEAIHQIVGKAEERSAAIFAFLRGKTNLDIYADLVQNDINMRTQRRGFFAWRRGRRVLEVGQNAQGRAGGQRIRWAKPPADKFGMAIA